MGSPWKMFTQTQGQELIDGTNSTWTTINGVNGRKFTSKTDSSKYIFLPAAGDWIDKNYYSAGEWGRYWSSKWDPSYYAYYINLSNSMLNIQSYDEPHYCFSVRAIIQHHLYLLSNIRVSL